ncbi:SAST synthase, partial [Polypterus senegalus]
MNESASVSSDWYCMSRPDSCFVLYIATQIPQDPAKEAAGLENECNYVISFGALTSFATAEYLKRVYGLEPTHLFVSGSSAPHSIARTTSQKTSELPDKEFLEWMTTVGGTPPEILGNPEVVNLFLPVLKADLRVVENYSYLKPPSSVLSCAITAFDGTEDVPHDIDAWKELTSGEFTKQMLPGSHFYLKDPQNEAHLVKYITKCLETTEIDYI